MHHAFCIQLVDFFQRDIIISVVDNFILYLDCAIYCCISKGCMKTFCTPHMHSHHRETRKSHTFVKLCMEIYP